jgi:hypothetical protein
MVSRVVEVGEVVDRRMKVGEMEEVEVELFGFGSARRPSNTVGPHLFR